MKIALVTPYWFNHSPNPGHLFITAGIMALLNKTCINPIFSYVDMMRPDPDHFEAARKTADLVVVCGNPRFNLSEGTSYWDGELFNQLGKLADQGMPIIDAYVGSAHSLPLPDLEKRVANLRACKKNQGLAKILKKFKLVISRDVCTSMLLDSLAVPSIQLPDSTFWAKNYFKVLEGDKTIDIIIVFRDKGNYSIIKTIQKTQQKMNEKRPCYVVCVNKLDYDWYTAEAGKNRQITLVDTAERLLRLMATAKRVLSMRVHTSIPAVSVGCEVAHISIDSRGSACIPFDIPLSFLSSFNDPEFFPEFGGRKINALMVEAVLSGALWGRKLIWNT